MKLTGSIRFLLAAITGIFGLSTFGLAGAEGTTDWRDSNTGTTWYYAGHNNYNDAAAVCGAVGGRLPSSNEVMTALNNGIARPNVNRNWTPRDINVLQAGSMQVWTFQSDPYATNAVGVAIDQSIRVQPKQNQLHTACIVVGGGGGGGGGYDDCGRFASAASCLSYDGGNGPYARGCRWSNTPQRCYNNRIHECSFYTMFGATACLDYDAGNGPYARGCRWDHGDNSCKHQ